MSSAQETETGTCFINAKRAVPLRTTLDEMGHRQGPTPIQVDNKTSEGIINEEFQQKYSKAIDMRFYWLLDRVKQKQFHVFWKQGPTNKADYVSKHHPTKHHINIHPTYVVNALKFFSRTPLQGCVGYPGCTTRTVKPVDHKKQILDIAYSIDNKLWRAKNGNL